MHRMMCAYDADSRSDGEVKCRSTLSAFVIEFAWARRILSSQRGFARYCQLEGPASLSTLAATTPVRSTLRKNEERLQESSSLQVFQ